MTSEAVLDALKNGLEPCGWIVFPPALGPGAQMVTHDFKFHLEPVGDLTCRELVYLVKHARLFDLLAGDVDGASAHGIKKDCRR